MGRYDWEAKQRQRQGESSCSNSGWWLMGVVAASLIGAILFIGYRDGFSQSSVASSSPDGAAGLSEAAVTSPPVVQPPIEPPAVAAQTPTDVDVSVQTHFDRCAEERVTCVVDGDTFWLNGVKIRVADYDTPEISKPHCSSEFALGQKATDRFIELLNRGPFQLTMQGSRSEDRYGRELRVVERDGKSLGDTLVAEGLAHPWVGHKLPWCD